MFEHSGTTIVNSKAVENADEYFFSTEKARELMNRHDESEWTEIYKKIISRHEQAKFLRQIDIANFCGVSENTVTAWKKHIPAKKEQILNLLLICGFGVIDNCIDEIDYILTRAAHKDEVSGEVSPMDTVFIFICSHYSYDQIKTIAEKGGLSPYFKYSDLAELYLSYSGKVFYNKEKAFLSDKKISKSICNSFSSSEQELLPEFISRIDKKEAYYEKSREMLKEYIQIYLNSNKKAKQKSIHQLAKNNRLKANFESTLSRFFGKTSNKLLDRDYIIMLGIHLGMTVDNINKMLELAHMDILSYKSPIDFGIIYALGQLEQKGKVSSDTMHIEVQEILESRELIEAFGPYYKNNIDVILKYFKSFYTSKSDTE